MIERLKNFLDNIPKKYEIFLPQSDSELLKKKCRIMMVSEEEYIANLVAIHVRPKDGGFRMITKNGLLIDSKGLNINQFLNKQFNE